MSDCTSEEALFAAKLAKYLSENKSVSKKERQFYVSSITISEIWSKTTDTQAKKIVNALNSSNVVFVPYDNDIAEFFNSKYNPILSNVALNTFARAHSWPEHDLVLAREWILRDVMLIATADYLKSDIILTYDKNTMIPLCDQFSVPVAYCVPICFNYNDTYIFTYDKLKIP